MKLVKIIGPIGVFIAIVISLPLWWVAPHVPSDQALEKQFYRQRPSLERLTAMLAEDSRMTRIAPDFLWTQDTAAWPRPESNWGISRFRWDEYKSLFNQAGIAMGVENRGNSKEAILIVYTWGIVPSGGECRLPPLRTTRLWVSSHRASMCRAKRFRQRNVHPFDFIWIQIQKNNRGLVHT
jgi:hypothetical protein